MFKITINWDLISPSLRVVSGIVSIYYVKFVTDPHQKLCKFRVKCEVNSTSYTSIEADKGYPSGVFNAFRPQLDLMVKNFRDGVLLRDRSFTWVIDEELEDANKNYKNLKTSMEMTKNYKEKTQEV